jgi:hypothetical protein
MSADGFQTTDLHFAAAMLYTFTEDALTRIEITPDRFDRYRNATFHIDAPSLDCSEYFKEFQSGELAISNLLSYVRTLTRLDRKVREMKRDGETSWVSDSWVRGRG